MFLISGGIFSRLDYIRSESTHGQTDPRLYASEFVAVRRDHSSLMSRLDELFDGLPMRLDVQDVSKLLGVSTKGVYRWIYDGVIPAYKLGATWLILRDELKDAMAQGSNLATHFTPDPDDTSILRGADDVEGSGEEE